MLLPRRPLLFLFVLASTAGWVFGGGRADAGDGGVSTPLPRAVGPTGIHPRLQRPVRLQRSIARRPEDAPPTLPESLPEAVSRRADPALEPATFHSPASASPLSLDALSTSVGGLEAVPPADAVPEEATSKASRAVEKSPAAEAEQTETEPGVRGGAREDDSRRVLATNTRPRTPANQGRGATALADFSWLPKPSLSMSSTVAAAALVSGLLLLTFAVLRRSMPRSARPLPQDVVRVLGRMPLAGKQTAQLMRIGGKLVLVSVGVDGAKPITEITDPEEVARLTGLVEQASPQGASAAFQQVFAEVAKQPAAPGFLGTEPASLFSTPIADNGAMIDRGQLAAAYANTPGGRANA